MSIMHALSRRRMRWAVAVLLTGISSAALSDDAPRDAPDHPTTPGASSPGPRLYDVTTETGMPHLEESLRYAIVRQRRCLDPSDLSRVFWMLGDVSLQDCRLQKTSQAEDGARYELHCDGGHGIMGSAQWRFEPDRLRGTLDVKLGGKNMTFYQRVVAQPVSSRPGDAATERGEAAEPAARACSPD